MGGVGVMFDGRLMSRGDIGNATMTSRIADGEGIWSTNIKRELGKRAYSAGMSAFVLVDCLSDTAIPGCIFPAPPRPEEWTWGS